MKTNKSPRRNVESTAALSVLAALAGIGVWIFARTPTPPIETFATIVVDASPTSDPGSRCEDVDRLGEGFLEGSRGSLRLALFSTGDRTTANEPVRVGAVKHTAGRRVLEGASGAGVARAAFLTELRNLCGHIQDRNESPIFRAIQAAVTSLPRDRCAAAQNHCEVVVRTDGLEEQDPTLVKTLAPVRARKASKRGRAPEQETLTVARAPEAPRIANEHVTVRFCGLSARRVSGKRAVLATPDVVASVFRREFSSPELVSFDPMCAGHHLASAAETRPSDLQRASDPTHEARP
jgi:hypothetical protein